MLTGSCSFLSFINVNHKCNFISFLGGNATLKRFCDNASAVFNLTLATYWVFLIGWYLLINTQSFYTPDQFVEVKLKFSVLELVLFPEHKVNFTLANCNLSLVNRGREILVLTLAQFLASIETRPSARAFKVSARVESFVVEGASVEHDLVPIITADNILTGW